MADEPQDREDFQVDGTYIQDRDMDNNGIPDWQQSHDNGSPENPYVASRDAVQNDDDYNPGAGTGPDPASPSASGASDPASPESDPAAPRADYGPEVASDAAYVRPTREAMAHVTATVDTAKPDEKTRIGNEKTADKANAKLGKRELENDSNPDPALSDPFYKKAMHDMEVRRLQKGPPKKSKLSEEVKRASAQRADNKDGFDLGRAMIAGMKGGAKHSAQRSAERRAARNAQRADELSLAFARSDAERRRDELAERKINERAKALEADASGPKPDGTSPDPAGPTGGGPDKPSGPDGPGDPDGGTRAPATPANDQEDPTRAAPAETAPTPANDREPAEPQREVARHAQIEDRAAAIHGERDPAASAKGKDAERTTAGAEPSAASGGDKARDASGPGGRTAELGDAKPAGRDVGAGQANGTVAMGGAMAAVNPVLGVAATAAQTRAAQKEAGNEHSPTAGKRPSPGRDMPGRLGPAPATIDRAGHPPVAGERRLAVPERGNVVDFPAPKARKGGLHAQAQSLPRNGRPVESRGPAAPAPRTRVMGVGSAMGKFIETQVRGPEGKGSERGGTPMPMPQRGRSSGR